jgi:hypothetical protein
MQRAVGLILQPAHFGEQHRLIRGRAQAQQLAVLDARALGVARDAEARHRLIQHLPALLHVAQCQRLLGEALGRGLGGLHLLAQREDGQRAAEVAAADALRFRLFEFLAADEESGGFKVGTQLYLAALLAAREFAPGGGKPPGAVQRNQQARAGRLVAPELAAPLYVRDKVALTTAERLARGGRA